MPNSLCVELANGMCGRTFARDPPSQFYFVVSGFFAAPLSLIQVIGVRLLFIIISSASFHFYCVDKFERNSLRILYLV